MDQESSNKSGGRGSWRDRLGINNEGGDALKTPAASPARPDAKVVSKPAPMAPRPGASAIAPERVAPAREPVAENKITPTPERPTPARVAQDDAFAERLRQHRAAAEEAVRKRAPVTGSVGKFSFAKDEVESAEAEKKADAPKPAAPGFQQQPAKPAEAVTAKPAFQYQAAAAPRPAAPTPPQAAQPVPRAPAPVPQPTRPVQVARPQAHANVPVPRPPQAAPQPPRPPQYAQPQPHTPPNGQNPAYGQHPPVYRPRGPGYAPPPGSRPQSPQGYGGAPAPYGRPAPAQQAPRPAAPPPRYAPAVGEQDLFEDNGYRPAAPIGRQQAAPSRTQDSLRAEFDDPFDDSREYTGRSASDYSRAYREYDDDFEEEQPRRRGGLIMLILALLTIAAVAGTMIVYYLNNKPETGGSTGDVPTIGAPQQPAKAAPDAASEQPASAPAQGKKLIYDRILGGEGASQPEQIVPREEAPQAPAAPSDDGNALPLPLPPPPGTQGSLTPGTAGPEPAQQTANVENNDQQTQGAVGVEPAASAVSETESSSGSIARPPVPRRKPQNLVASVQQAPSTQFRPVLQPAPAPAVELQQQFNPPQQLQQQQAAVVNPEIAAPQSSSTAGTRVGRDDDPLAGLRAPLNSGTQSTQTAPQVLQQPTERVAVAPQPVPQQVPQQQQPITSQTLQSFAPPEADQQSATASSGTGYVVQLAAYRSEQEAMGEYQQLKSRYGNLVGNLPPAVQQTNLGASGTFYRLGMGPMSSKQAATELCNKLIAAGERDCLVRRR